MTVHTPIGSQQRGVAGWALALSGVMVLAGVVYFATNLDGTNPPIAGEPSPSGSGGGGNALAIMGQAGCQGCHGPDLAGLGNFPSLLDVKNGPVSENLQQLYADQPEDWIAIWITGTDPAVSDPAMRGGMPAFGPTLTPEEIATVVEYLKTLE